MSSTKLKVTTNVRPKSRLAIEIAVPAERCQSSYDEALSKLSRSIKLPGFRKGKVPKAVLVQQIGIMRIRATALERLVDEIWRETLEQESINALCEPELGENFETLLKKFKPGEDLILSLETDVAPIAKLKATKGLTAEVQKVVFDPNKIEELIEQSRKELATLIPIEDRSAKMGDVAVISFKGTYKEDGMEIEGGSSESMDLDLEKGRMIEGFVEGIIEMQIGEKKVVECQFPKEYPNEKARGKKALFEISLNELKTRELPDLNDDFAKQTSDKNNMKELREELENRLKEDAKEQEKNNINEALIKALVKELDAEIPETLLQQEIRNLIEQTATQFAQQGMDVKSMFTPELVKSLMESSRDEAQENVRRNLAMQTLAKNEKLEPNKTDVEKKFKELQKQFSNKKNIDYQKLKQAVVEDLQQEQILKWLEENSKIIEKESGKSSKPKNGSSKPKSAQSKSNAKKPSEKKNKT